ncbi:MAG: RNA polymerase sigma factor, partial [Hydrogeniiclostridium sp.]
MTDKHSGRPDTESMEELVGRARRGDTDAVSALYEQTYSKVYYTVKSMIKNEDDVLDVLQDAYLKAFTHLKSFEGGEKFLPWVKQIAANTARDRLRRKTPALFGELTADETQTPAEERIPDERPAFLPEASLDAAETQRLIREILDSLPDDQRAVVGMYYYEELSVREIAEALGVSESAVKSRLLYARRKIEARVRDLEKKGTKLYGAAPLPFLLFLLRSQQANAARPDPTLLQRVLEATQAAAQAGTGSASAAEASQAAAQTGAGSASAAGAAAGAGAAGTAAAGLAGWKLALALIAMAVAGGGIVAGVSLATGAFGGQPQDVPAVVADGVSLAESQSAAESAQSVPEAETVSSEAAPEPETDPVGLALASYRALVPTADTLYYGYDKTPTGIYRYALCRLNAEDDFPSIVLEQQAETLEYHMLVYRWNEETGEAARVAGSADDGETRGGLRTGLSQMADGDGLRHTVVYSATGETVITRFTQNDQEPRALSFVDEWTGAFTDPIPESLDFYELVWYDVSDLSGLESWSWPPAAPSGGSVPQDVPSSVSSAAPAQDGDRIVFTGTIDTYT